MHTRPGSTRTLAVVPAEASVLENVPAANDNSWTGVMQLKQAWPSLQPLPGPGPTTGVPRKSGQAGAPASSPTPAVVGAPPLFEAPPAAAELSPVGASLDE